MGLGKRAQQHLSAATDDVPSLRQSGTFLVYVGPDVHIHMCGDFTDIDVVLRNTPTTMCPGVGPSVHCLSLQNLAHGLPPHILLGLTGEYE